MTRKCPADPTPDEAEALRRFAAARGHHWKAQLRRLWDTGVYPTPPADAVLLQGLRNRLGPTWLATYNVTYGAPPRRFQPIRMTFGFAIGAALVAAKWDKPGGPTARELARITKKLPDLFPEPWSLEDARYALEHLDERIEVAR